MKVEIYIPSSLDDITLGQYQKFHKISDGKENNDFINQKMIEIFCRIDLKDVIKIKYHSLNKILRHIDNLFKQKQSLQKTFTYNKKEYGFIPKLDDITFGEYIDLDTYLSDWNSMHKAMSVLYRPVNYKSSGKYLIDKYEGINETMKDMPLSVVMGSLIFFYNLSKELSINTLKSLTVEEVNSLSKLTSEKSGAGISLYMELLEETLGTLTKSPVLAYTNV